MSITIFASHSTGVARISALLPSLAYPALFILCLAWSRARDRYLTSEIKRIEAEIKAAAEQEKVLERQAAQIKLASEELKALEQATRQLNEA